MSLRKAIARFDLEEYVRDTFDPVEVVEDEHRIDCFSCGESKQHLYVNTEKKVWICFKCGYGDGKQQPGTNSLIQFIADAEQISKKKVAERLLGQITKSQAEQLGDLLEGVFSKREVKEPEEPKEIVLPKSFRPVVSGGSPVFQAIDGFDYLKGRGLTTADMARHDIRYCDIGKKWRKRVIFPVRNDKAVLCSAVGRSKLETAKSRWYNWPGTDIQSLLWPLTSMSPAMNIILVEGVFDAIAVRRFAPGYWYANVLCTFGKKLSDKQIDVLHGQKPVSITLAWDFDARKNMIHAVDKLRGRFQNIKVFPHRSRIWSAHDFGDMLPEGDVEDDIVRAFQKDMENLIDIDGKEYTEWQLNLNL